MRIETGMDLVRRLHVAGYEQYRLYRRKHNANSPESKMPARTDRRAFLEYLDTKG